MSDSAAASPLVRQRPVAHERSLCVAGPVPYDEVRAWLLDRALPFWAQHGVDREHGGFVEQLTLTGANRHAPFKRTRVLARQIYVFAHAADLGFPGAAEIAEEGFAHLVRTAWLGPRGGWARRLSEQGRVIDATADLYDIAFVLNACGWLYRLTGARSVRDWSFRTLDFVESCMRHPSGIGFLSERPVAGPRLQNPHMHLLEATLINLEATGDERFRQLADELVRLFCDHLFQPARGIVAERFTEDLAVLPDSNGILVEPGHHFEWAWILAWYQRLTGRDIGRWAEAVVAFAERHGVDPQSGATYDLIHADGCAHDCGERVWPAAERIQAAVAIAELTGRDCSAMMASSARRLLDVHLAHAPAGTWLDHFDAAGRPKVQAIPASTLYHLMISFTELLRHGDTANGATRLLRHNA